MYLRIRWPELFMLLRLTGVDARHQGAKPTIAERVSVSETRENEPVNLEPSERGIPSLQATQDIPGTMHGSPPDGLLLRGRARPR